VFLVCPCTKFYLFSSSVYQVTAIKMKASENVDVTAVMLFSLLQKVTVIEPPNYSKIVV